MAVTLINVFTVPKGKESEFVKWWQDVKENITAQQGFISGKFHRSIKPESRYNFINVAVWENEDVYWKAYEKSVTPMKAKLERTESFLFMTSGGRRAYSHLRTDCLYSLNCSPNFAESARSSGSI